MNCAVSGQRLSTTPRDDIETYFDGMAADFDKKLVGSLHYRAPAFLAGIASKYRDRFATILDLGCGTGLPQGRFAALGDTVVGIDLSAAMLEKARQRGVYAELVKTEAVDYLTATANRFDLIFAADALIYVGDIEALFKAASAALSGGGLFVFSIETTRDPGFELRPSGRFAHSRSYIEAVCGDDFTVLESITDTLRLDMRQPIEGEFIALRRRQTGGVPAAARASGQGS